MHVSLSPMEFARRARALYADRTAVVDGELRLTYAEFFDRCDRWSRVLAGFGVGHGDRVAYIAPNTHAQLESFYAVPALGAVVVPLNYRLIADDFAYMIEHSGSKVVCVHSDYLDAVDAIRARCPHVTHWVALEGARAGWLDYEALVAAAEPGPLPAVTIDEKDLLTINYTSGTTSRPKGVMITHRNAWVNCVGTLVHHPMTSADKYLWTLPMFHANGWTFVWINTAVGATHVCLRKVDPPAVFEHLEREKVTLLCAAPTVLISIANAPDELRRRAPRGVRVLTAGAPPAASTIERIEAELGWSLLHVYGLTETSPFITVCEPRESDAGLSVQERARIKARQGVELITSGELRVVDDAMHDVPRDGQTIGEIVVRGNAVMDGYFRDPEATERAFLGGYFHSGDSAVIHPDGYVEIRDRMKDVIISGGENISSIEVEGVLLRHPAVQEVAVVGMPHEKWGEAPHAFVVLKQGKDATEAELRTFARDNMAHFKAPQAVHFVKELPKTATGKIQKYVLRGGRSGISTQ
ncbi:long-chain-fatty-acid--CoA ligase [Pendulispora brunnea]|uniref:Long-chain-fatty-acid--CoA ligase n=1 Tax=Pendulispora brunnea TaxID=2905690 RepID=A0ABZ2KBC3_9BACT